MSSQITTAFVQQYSANVQMLVQQMDARLPAFVRNESVTGEFAYFDQIGRAEAIERVTRHGDTPLLETPHSRRQVALRSFEWADLIDRQDLVRTLINPESQYARAAAAAMQRKMDDVLIEAATGSAKTGKTGSTTTSLPAGQLVAVDYVESGSTANSGMTIAKLRRAKVIMDGAEVDNEDRYVVCAAKQVQDLLRTTEVTSSDFNTVRALVAGEVDTFLGFRFIRSERLGTSSTHRRCFAFQRQGILLAVGQAPQARITERADKSYSTQVYYSMDIGATRMEEERVVQILCAE
jgi:hypothetical protein